MGKVPACPTTPCFFLQHAITPPVRSWMIEMCCEVDAGSTEPGLGESCDGKVCGLLGKRRV